MRAGEPAMVYLRALPVFRRRNWLVFLMEFRPIRKEECELGPVKRNWEEPAFLIREGKDPRVQLLMMRPTCAPRCIFYSSNHIFLNSRCSVLVYFSMVGKVNYIIVVLVIRDALFSLECQVGHG